MDIVSKHFDEALLKIKKVIDVKELMNNETFRSLIYYYSAIINIYINNFSSADKFLKKGIASANKVENSFLVENFKKLDEKIKELKKDPRDLTEKLVALANIESRTAFKLTQGKLSTSNLPDKIYSIDEIREFYLPIATSKFGDPFKVIETLEKALEMTKGSNDPKIIAEKANILYYLGAAQITIEEYDHAEDRLKKGLEICKQVGNSELAQRIERILNNFSEYRM
ncbi:MAG: hypothetical protein ACTSPY_09310 [Candidatus Helarchaeota archaeon]